MSAESPIPRPGRARSVERYASLDDALRQPDAKLCFVLPLGVSFLVAVLAFNFAPTIEAGTAGEFSSLFSTAAQVIVTLLVALAIELRSLRELNAQRMIISGTLSYIAIGAGAAMLALNPNLGSDVYRWLFALTLGAGVGALLSVILIAYQGFEADVKERRKVKTRKEGNRP